MAQNKTRPTDSSVDTHLAALTRESQRADCAVLAKLMRDITRCEPRMWGSTIVGFGSYRYRYDSGREGEACLTGFAARASEIVVYLFDGSPGQADRLARLGRHRMGQSCLYLRRLSDVDVAVLEQLIRESVAEVQRRHPPSPGVG